MQREEECENCKGYPAFTNTPGQTRARRPWKREPEGTRARPEDANHSRLDGFRDRADLIDLEQQAVAGLFLHGALDALWVGHCQVITHYLDADVGCELGPSCPIILVKWVFDGDHCRGSREGPLLLLELWRDTRL